MCLLPYPRPYNSHKLEFRTSKCVFLGYSSFHKGYRCLDKKGKIYICRSVEFDETNFPYEQLFSPSTLSQSNETVPTHNFLSSPNFFMFESSELNLVPCSDQSCPISPQSQPSQPIQSNLSPQLHSSPISGNNQSSQSYTSPLQSLLSSTPFSSQ